jgi:hypothetical protein
MSSSPVLVYGFAEPDQGWKLAGGFLREHDMEYFPTGVYGSGTDGFVYGMATTEYDKTLDLISTHKARLEAFAEKFGFPPPAVHLALEAEGYGVDYDEYYPGRFGKDQDIEDEDEDVSDAMGQPGKQAEGNTGTGAGGQSNSSNSSTPRDVRSKARSTNKRHCQQMHLQRHPSYTLAPRGPLVSSRILPTLPTTVINSPMSHCAARCLVRVHVASARPQALCSLPRPLMGGRGVPAQVLRV